MSKLTNFLMVVVMIMFALMMLNPVFDHLEGKKELSKVRAITLNDSGVGLALSAASKYASQNYDEPIIIQDIYLWKGNDENEYCLGCFRLFGSSKTEVFLFDLESWVVVNSSKIGAQNR